ncbi:MAG: thiazole synthase [Candidatus Eiseniibacteriota bacterium]
MDGTLAFGDHRFTSRLIVGTGKYTSPEIMREAIAASGAEMVTVAIGRVDLSARGSDTLLDQLDWTRYTILPNTAGAYSAREAIRIANLARAAELGELIKLEVIGDRSTLMPDTAELLIATEELVRDGFTVLPYTNDDPIMARRLEEAGAAAIMPLASPIGSGLGILNPLNIELLRSKVSVPVIVDAGVGTASDAAIAMELGVDGILMNSGIALARDPVRMGEAMRLAVQAGRLAYEAGRMARGELGATTSAGAGVGQPMAAASS